ncbi:MAG TPA: hypothetical protein VI278_09665, partial [Nitrososphaeraceae archaeon]
ADYEIPYERHKKAKEERLKYGMEEDRNAIDEYSEMYHILHAKKKPEYITEEQWQLAKRKARDYIKEIKYNDVEFRFKIEYNPLRIFEDKISNISEFCECTASGLRQGICCDICKLIKNFSNSSILLCAVS